MKKSGMPAVGAVNAQKYRGNLVVKSNGEVKFTPFAVTGESRYELLWTHGKDKVEKICGNSNKIKMTVYVKADTTDLYTDLMNSTHRLLSRGSCAAIFPTPGVELGRSEGCRCCIMPDNVLEITVTEPMMSGKDYAARYTGHVRELLQILYDKKTLVGQCEKRAARKLSHSLLN